MKFRTILVAGLLAAGAAGAALAADKGGDGEREVRREVIVKHRGGPMGHASVEFTAMRNIMAEMLSARTGKTTAEIQALFEKGGAHEALETLGIDKDEARPMFKEARQQLITRSAAAGLITAQQAEKLRSAKFEKRHKKRRHRDDAAE